MIVTQTLIIVAAILSATVGSLKWWQRYESKSLDAALYLELVSMRFQAGVLAVEITRQYEADRPLDKAFFSIWRLSAPLIYPAMGGDLGKLRPQWALDRVGYFHAQLAEARGRIAHVIVSGDSVSEPYRLLSNIMRAHNHVDVWVNLHEPRFGSLPVGLIDLTPAHQLLELLETASGEVAVQAYCWADTCVRYARQSDFDKGN